MQPVALGLPPCLSEGTGPQEGTDVVGAVDVICHSELRSHSALNLADERDLVMDGAADDAVAEPDMGEDTGVAVARDDRRPFVRRRELRQEPRLDVDRASLAAASSWRRRAESIARSTSAPVGAISLNPSASRAARRIETSPGCPCDSKPPPPIHIGIGREGLGWMPISSRMNESPLMRDGVFGPQAPEKRHHLFDATTARRRIDAERPLLLAVPADADREP